MLNVRCSMFRPPPRHSPLAPRPSSLAPRPSTLAPRPARRILLFSGGAAAILRAAMLREGRYHE
jgi:hypothetical protein